MRRAYLWKSSRGLMGAVIEDGRTLRRLALPRRSRGEVLRELGEGPAVPLADSPPPGLAEAVERYFRGEDPVFPFRPEAGGGTPFQRRVWRECARIPRGEVRTYGRLARRLGLKGGARAVGQAMGANPLPLVVP